MLSVKRLTPPDWLMFPTLACPLPAGRGTRRGFYPDPTWSFVLEPAYSESGTGAVGNLEVVVVQEFTYLETWTRSRAGIAGMVGGACGMGLVISFVARRPCGCIDDRTGGP